MAQVTHDFPHKTHYEESNCQRSQSTIFVDDCFGIVISTKNLLINDIMNYIGCMNRYYLMNRLKNNIQKSKFMIISDSKKLRN